MEPRFQKGVRVCLADQPEAPVEVRRRRIGRPPINLGSDSGHRKETG